MRRSGLPSLRGLQVFEAAARCENFSRAADELAVTQSAVSRQILQLERELGCTLFERRGPHLELTNTGRVYFEIVREGLSVLRRGTNRLFGKVRSPYLTVTTVPSFATRWLMPRLSGFESVYPDIPIRIAAGFDLVDFDVDTDVDLAIRYGRGNWPRLCARPLAEEFLFPVCSPALATRIKRREDICKQRLLFEDRRFDQWRQWADATGIRIELKSQDHLSDDFNIQLQAAMLGHGVALGRSILVADDLRSGRLVCPVREPVRSNIQYYVVCPKERVAEPAIDRFVKWLVASAQDSVTGLDRFIRDTRLKTMRSPAPTPRTPEGS